MDYFLLGKNAFESGNYRQSIAAFEKAKEGVNLQSFAGGDVQMWLVTAYEAAGETDTAIDLCQQLLKHPHLEIRDRSKKLLYILKAPQLKRPAEWLTEIPDFSKLEDGTNKYISPRSSPRKTADSEIEVPPEPSIGDDSSGGFLWLAMGVGLLLLGGLAWLAYS